MQLKTNSTIVMNPCEKIEERFFFFNLCCTLYDIQQTIKLISFFVAYKLFMWISTSCACLSNEWTLGKKKIYYTKHIYPSTLAYTRCISRGLLYVGWFGMLFWVHKNVITSMNPWITITTQTHSFFFCYYYFTALAVKSFI